MVIWLWWIWVKRVLVSSGASAAGRLDIAFYFTWSSTNFHQPEAAVPVGAHVGDCALQGRGCICDGSNTRALRLAPTCSSCAHEEHIFGKDGARDFAESSGFPFLGDIPLTSLVRATSDDGQPIVLAHPTSPTALKFLSIAATLRDALNAAKPPAIKMLVQD